MLTSSDWLTEISCYRIIFQKINTTRIPDKFLPKIPWLAVILIEECFHHQPSWTMIMKVTQLFSCLMKYFLLQLLIVKAKSWTLTFEWTLTNWNLCCRVRKTFRSHRHHKVLALGTYWYLRVSTFNGVSELDDNLIPNFLSAQSDMPRAVRRVSRDLHCNGLRYICGEYELI